MANNNVANLSKLTSFQHIVPAFDNASAVTPKYFFDTIDNLTVGDEFCDNDRLIIAKSRLRGEALTHMINSHSLSNEKSYENFKKQLIDFFGKSVSQAVTQVQFSNLKMGPSESVKEYANRVANATAKFFGKADTSLEPIIAVLDQTKLSKFIEGLREDYKGQLIIKDPKNITEAIEFVELLEANAQFINPTSHAHVFNTLNTNTSNTLLDTHIQATHELISSLTKKVEDLTLERNRKTYTQPRECTICHKSNHTTRDCYYNYRNYTRPNYPPQQQWNYGYRSYPQRNMTPRPPFNNFSNSTRNQNRPRLQFSDSSYQPNYNNQYRQGSENSRRGRS